jgi:hypothetical protein
MTDADRKKTADAIVVSIGHSEKPKGEDAKKEPDAGLLAAMEDFLAATQAKDPAAMAESFSYACELCPASTPSDD